MPCALPIRSEEHTSELQSHDNLVCRLLLEKKKGMPVSARAQSTRTRPLSACGSAGCRVGGCPSAHCVVLPSFHFSVSVCLLFFFFNDTATTEIYPLSLRRSSD